MKENKLVDLSMDFAVDIIKLCEAIKGHYSSTNQLERSATSIGANIHEVNNNTKAGVLPQRQNTCSLFYWWLLFNRHPKSVTRLRIAHYFFSLTVAVNKSPLILISSSPPCTSQRLCAIDSPNPLPSVERDSSPRTKRSLS